MLYFANPTVGVSEAMRNGLLGFINTPAQGNKMPHGVRWCADNGCGPGKRGTGGGYPGDVAFLRWLAELQPFAPLCHFAVAPDVVGDSAATLKRSAPFLPVIRALGYPAALAAQDGLENLPVPWDEFDVLFLGGSTAWKLSTAARDLTAEAHGHGKPVHMGRVNSLRRLRYAHHIGCDSADGTYLIFGPDENLPKLLGWLRDVNYQGVLFGGDAA